MQLTRPGTERDIRSPTALSLTRRGSAPDRTGRRLAARAVDALGDGEGCDGTLSWDPRAEAHHETDHPPPIREVRTCGRPRRGRLRPLVTPSHAGSPPARPSGGASCPP